MIRHVILSGVAGAVALTGYAQTSVALYGQIDNGIFYSTNQNGNHAVQFVASPTESTRWGLRGAEDLGGGTKAIFGLASCFSSANGTTWPSGSLFGNYAWVGLSNNAFGNVKLGRMLDTVGDYLGDFASGGSWGGSFYAHPLDNDNVWGTFFVNNAVKVQSVSLAGVELGGMYGFSNKSVATSGSGSGFADNRLWAAGARYSTGTLKFAAVYEQLDRPGDDAPGSSGAVDVADANFTAARQRIYGVGVSYALDHVDLISNITRTTLSSPTGEWQNAQFTGASSMSFNNYEIDAIYHATTALEVKGAYTYSAASVSGKSPHWNQVGLLVEYALSRRTRVYADGVFQRVHGDGSQFSYAQINNLSPASGDSQALFGIGIAHRF